MATVTVVQGNPQELKELLPGIFSQFAAEDQSPVQVAYAVTPPVPQTGTGTWSFDEFKRYWGMVKPGSANFLKELAAYPTGLHSSKLKQKFGWNYNQLAGTLAPLKRLVMRFPGKPMLYGRDNTVGYNDGWTYTMEPYIADFIRQAP